jgi:hypothetical protein
LLCTFHLRKVTVPFCHMHHHNYGLTRPTGRSSPSSLRARYYTGFAFRTQYQTVECLMC